MKRLVSTLILGFLVLGSALSEIKDFELILDDPKVAFQSKEYYMIIVRKYLDLGFIANAERDQKEALQRYPKDLDILLLYGDILYAKQDPLAEYSYYSELLKDYPREAKIYIKRSYADLDLEKDEQYLSDLLMANELAPGNALVLGNIGLAYLERKDYDPAESFLLGSYKADAKRTSTINNLASLCYYRENYEKALEWVNLSLGINDQNSYSYRIRAFIYEKLGRIEDSKADFARVK